MEPPNYSDSNQNYFSLVAILHNKQTDDETNSLIKINFVRTVVKLSFLIRFNIDNKVLYLCKDHTNYSLTTKTDTKKQVTRITLIFSTVKFAILV